MAKMTTTQMLTGIKNWVLGKIANITALIPLQASPSNQLADKAFVNSSIATATATFRGTYNVVTDLSLSYIATHSQIASALATKMVALSIVADNNDYAYVQIPTADATPTEIAKIEKYKYNGSAWAFEYELNNSGFTAEQWAAINSGATLELIGKLSVLPTNAQLTELLNGKVSLVDNGAYDVSANNGGITFASLSALLSSQNLSTLIPTAVRQPGMSIKFKQGTSQSSDNKYVQARLMAQDFTTDVTQWQVVDKEPTNGSENLVRSGGVYNIVSIKAYKKTGKNLLDLHDINYLEHSDVNFQTGNIIYREGTDLSGYISVEAGKTYHISNMYDESINLVPIGNTIGIACYNSNLEFLEAIPSALNFTISQNAAYIRVSIDRIQLNQFPMVEEGSTRTDYEPFSGVGGDEIIADIKRRLQLTSAEITIVPYPVREPYTQEIAGYFRGYTVNLDGMYGAGVRGVLFLGSNYTLDSNIRCGVTLDENGDVVDVAMGTVGQTSDWYLLPVTAETKLLHATYCINSEGGIVVNPTRVVMLDVKTYEAIIRTSEITSLSEQVDLLLGEIYGTQQTARTYTFLGDGVLQTLNPPIGVGDEITAFSDTVPRLVLYTTNDDDDNNPTYVYQTDLPFAVDKEYVSVRCYHQSRPTVTINVEHGSDKGLKAIVEQLQEEIDDVSKLPDTFLPKKIYGVIGDTMQIYNRGVTISQEPNRYYNDWECGQGKIYKRYLEITPALSNGSVPTGLTIKHRLIDDHYNKTVQKSSSFVVSARPSSPSNRINVLCVGASTTQNGEWASELKRRLTDTLGSGTPAADGLTNITFVGRKNLDASWNRPVAVKIEATGGWQWSTFYTPQAAVRFIVSSVTSVNIGDVYSYTNANNETVKVAVAEVNITGNSGNIRFTYNWDTEGHGIPAAASGTITKVSGSGDATIAYSSAESETYCPFYNDESGQPDFSVYAETYCNNQIDVAIFYLGNINAGVMGDESLVALIASMKTMLDALHADFPNCKVIIAPGIGYSTYYGLEYNYNASSKYKSWAALYAQFRYAKTVEDFIGNNNYKDWCFLANTMAETDSEYVFPLSTKAVNTRVATTEVIGTNGAHPTLQGYQMIADSIYRVFINEVLINNNQ